MGANSHPGRHADGGEQPSLPFFQAMRKIGYARVGSFDKGTNTEAQRLANAGCSEVFKDTDCGPGAARPSLDEVMSKLRAGDTLVVCALSRPAKSIKHLMELATELE
ncbi:hypothetical protein GP727_23595, partial [Escherichia coli]